MIIREATYADRALWHELRVALWPDEKLQEEELAHFLSDSDQVCFLALDNDLPVGFIEMSLRKYAEGCSTSPVAFVEGWFVKEDYREQGIGAKLLQAGESWGRSRGCTELGSDTEVWRTQSRAVHRKLGFEEVAEIVAFRKPLG